MNSDLKSEDILCKIKEILNNDKIKLWLHPYYNSDTHSMGQEEENALQILCKQISENLNIDEVLCLCALRDLQNRALDRLKSNAVFKETGVASLRIKVSGEMPKMLNINISLAASTSELTEEVSSGVGVTSNRIKLISHGQVLKPTESLASQGVKNAMLLMAVILDGDDKLQKDEKRLKTLEDTKKDLHLLTRINNPNNDYYFQLENQSGEAITLPDHERKALVTAMALHEKGRAALNKEDYSLALVLLLEADKEFSECTSQILTACDNYALLHLDISWCYLCLRNPAQIPDADKRLSFCEENFHKSYGPNLERLIAIKGTTGNEAALFMRLHLLQGVVLFHQNKRAEAKRLFERAQSELNGLKVDDKSLCLLLELGFTSAEARLGLRATYGNVEAAEELIFNKRKDMKLAREHSQLRLKNEWESKKLGLCEDGKQFCDQKCVEQLVTMGFDRNHSIAALKLTNNRVSDAISVIQDQPHLLPSGSHTVPQESIAQLVSLGFDPNVAQKAFKKYPELENAVKSLQLLGSQDATTSSSAAAIPSAINLIEKIRRKYSAKEQETKQAFKRVSEDLIDKDLTEDHLDLNLAQEEQFLVEYMSLLN